MSAPMPMPIHLVWMSIASILVLFMTIPGIALFYGGLVRQKNVLSIVAQSFTIAALTTLMWVIIGYSLSFTKGHAEPFIGGLQAFLLHNINVQHPGSTVHTIIYLTYQMGFAIITPALIIGAFAERMKFLTMIFFIFFWELLVYYPIAHWFWGDGWLQQMGILDFAGGSVVHENAGIAGLVAAILLGQRKEFLRSQIRPHNITLVAIGAGILWIGWFGFNGGGASHEGRAGLAILDTQIAASSGALAWMVTEWFTQKKPSALGILFGAVTGLVAITPACGYVGPMASIIIGALPAVVSYYLLNLKYRCGYDDALDAFGIHGIGGILGSLLTGIFAARVFNGVGLAPGMTMLKQILIQLLGIVTVVIWSGGWTYIILKILDRRIGLRVSAQTEKIGLDISDHGEIGYHVVNSELEEKEAASSQYQVS